MTTQDAIKAVAAMTPEEKRIKIAEACGWKNIRQFNRDPESEEGPGIGMIGTPAIIGSCTVPDYLTDLNAMQDAVMSNRDKLSGYCMNLRRIVHRHISTEDGELYGDINYYHATAAQRADAFLITILTTN